MKHWWFPVLLLVFTACSQKKTDLSGDVPVKASDFIAAFPPIGLPVIIADTNITKITDTVTIGYKVLQQFFPDSVLATLIGKDSRWAIHPVGRFEKDKENYLLVNFTNRRKIKKLAVFVTDKKNKFLASKELLSTDMDADYTHAVSINREPTFLISKEKTGRDNVVLFTRTGWIYTAGSFMVVINDSNEDPKKSNVINPIDTLPRKNKYSGDYIQDKKNFISLRDSKKPNTYLFFVHFEKEEGSCTGELKGELTMKDAASAQYTGKGDPCVIDFKFDGNEITLKEQGTCGNHRGIKCFFDDTFTKKRESRTKKK